MLSSPVRFNTPLLVILSAVLVPLSVAKARVGALAVVSSVKVYAVLGALALPAASVWRTSTLLAPSPVRVTLVPTPGVQLAPASVLYCQVAPLSRPVTLRRPLLVILSAVLVPLSVARLRLGAEGRVLSSFKLLLVCPNTPPTQFAPVLVLITLLLPRESAVRVAIVASPLTGAMAVNNKVAPPLPEL